jgi:hypothetical protein
LAHVPKLGDVAVLESKDVNHCGAAIAGFLSHVRVNCHEIAVLERVFDFQRFAWILRRVLFHRFHERFSVATEERIVMAKTCDDMLLIGRDHVARGSSAEEGNRNFLA